MLERLHSHLESFLKSTARKWQLAPSEIAISRKSINLLMEKAGLSPFFIYTTCMGSWDNGMFVQGSNESTPGVFGQVHPNSIKR
jgi:hypothetical protein